MLSMLYRGISCFISGIPFNMRSRIAAGQTNNQTRPRVMYIFIVTFVDGRMEKH